MSSYARLQIGYYASQGRAQTLRCVVVLPSSRGIADALQIEAKIGILIDSRTGVRLSLPVLAETSQSHTLPEAQRLL